MKSCIYRVETGNAGMRLQGLRHHLRIPLLQENGLTESAYKIHFVTKFCNQYPMAILHITGLPFYNGKIGDIKIWNIVRGKGTTVPVPELSDTVDYLLDRNTFHFKFFSNNTNLSTAAEDIRSPNTMRTVTCSSGKVKFSPSLSGSPTSSLCNDNFQ